jgi:predicted GIY-YIG superfamily endonuclease
MESRRSNANEQVGTVYLLHFSDPTAAGHQHYLGWTTDLPKRLARHRAGRGAEETKRAVSEGLKLKLAQSWPGTPVDERRIKDDRRAARRGYGCLCPYCQTADDRAAELVRGMGPPELRVQHVGSLEDRAAADALRSPGGLS